MAEKSVLAGSGCLRSSDRVIGRAALRPKGRGRRGGRSGRRSGRRSPRGIGWRNEPRDSREWAESDLWLRLRQPTIDTTRHTTSPDDARYGPASKAYDCRRRDLLLVACLGSWWGYRERNAARRPLEGEGRV